MSSHFSFFKLFNVFLRISGVGGKFLVFAVLSKYLTDSDYGNYSLIISFITIMIFLLGFDFYNYSVRDIIKTASKENIANKLFTSFTFYLVVYALFFFISKWFLIQIDYINDYFIIIFFLCVSEHLNQEIYRLQIGFNQILWANTLLFFRTMGWGAIVLFLLYQNNTISIHFILKIWLLSDILVIALVFGVLLVKNWQLLAKLKFYSSWFKKGLKVSFLFLIGTVFLKIIEYSNRFIVDYYLGEEKAGIFTFFSSMAIVVTLYINTIVISFEVPALIKATNYKERMVLFKKFKRSLLYQVITISLILTVLIKPILKWQDKPTFEAYLPTFFILLVGVVIMNYSLYHHFILYVKHKDKSILKVTVLSGLLGVIVSVLLIKFYGLYGASIGFLISGVLMGLFRVYELKRYQYD